MLKALFYCHKVVKVIHRDIKPDNIMINHDDVAVLIDFGVSAIIEGKDNDEMQNNMGSYMFFAPEMFLSKSDGVKVRGERTDIWALGITLYYLLSGRYPFITAKDPLTLRELIVDHPINFQPIVKPQARNLLQKILEKDPDKRITLEALIEDEWVTNRGKNMINVRELKEEGIFGDVDR